MRRINVTPHAAQNVERNGGSAIDGRTTRHPGYAPSLRARKLIEEDFDHHRDPCETCWGCSHASETCFFNSLLMEAVTSKISEGVLVFESVEL